MVASRLVDSDIGATILADGWLCDRSLTGDAERWLNIGPGRVGYFPKSLSRLLGVLSRASDGMPDC